MFWRVHFIRYVENRICMQECVKRSKTKPKTHTNTHNTRRRLFMQKQFSIDTPPPPLFLRPTNIYIYLDAFLPDTHITLSNARQYKWCVITVDCSHTRKKETENERKIGKEEKKLIYWTLFKRRLWSICAHFFVDISIWLASNVCWNIHKRT